MKEKVKKILQDYMLTDLTLNDATQQVLDLFSVSNRFSTEQMAEWFHDNYEEIAKAEGWQTQDKCKVEFKDLPESNRITMIKVCERWLNSC
jgi:hypothetical protein